MKARSYILLSGFVLLKFILQFALVDNEYELHRDEFLHLDQANHLAWGYFSVPPFTSWVAFIIQVLGNDLFWIRFFPALFGALTILVVWETVKLLKGNLYGQCIAATAILLSVMLRINLLFQPNSFDILCWTLTFYSLVRFIKYSNNNWLLIAGVVVGIGFLNKYNILFLLLGLLLALLITNRKLFLNKYLYFAAGIAFLIALPNLIWQLQHDFPVVSHMDELASTQLVNVSRSDFLKEQLLFFLGSIFLVIGGLTSFYTYLPFKKYRLFFWTYIFTMLFFLFFRAKGYYAIGLYPVLISFGAVYIEHITKGRWLLLLRPVVILIIIAAFIPMYFLSFPNAKPAILKERLKPHADIGLLRWEDGKNHHLPQDFADMLAWKELANKVERLQDSINDQYNTLILANNYGQAGAINYYTDLKAVSFNTDYIHWFPDIEVKQIIYISEPGHENEEILNLFESRILTAKVTNQYAREYGTRIYILTHPNKSVKALSLPDL